MRKLIKGIVDFRSQLTEEKKSLFSKLALGQKPDALFIGCCDSRVVPNLFASTNPGDLFVLRNIGNIVPPASLSLNESSVPAALEFSVCSLNVTDIIVCGHSSCGAIEALINGVDASSVKSWLKYAEGSLKKREGLIVDPSLSEQDKVSQVNVLQQMEHIESYSFIKERVEKKELRIHGWWFDIAQASVYCYEPSLNRYILIDEKEAALILERLG